MKWVDSRLRSRLEEIPGFLGSVLVVELGQIFADRSDGVWELVTEKDLVLDRPVAWHWRVQIGELVVSGDMDEREDARLAAINALSYVAVRLHEESVALNTACHAMPPTHLYVLSSAKALVNLGQIREQVNAAFKSF